MGFHPAAVTWQVECSRYLSVIAAPGETSCHSTLPLDSCALELRRGLLEEASGSRHRFVLQGKGRPASMGKLCHGEMPVQLLLRAGRESWNLWAAEGHCSDVNALRVQNRKYWELHECVEQWMGPPAEEWSDVWMDAAAQVSLPPVQLSMTKSKRTSTNPPPPPPPLPTLLPAVTPPPPIHSVTPHKTPRHEFWALDGVRT